MVRANKMGGQKMKNVDRDREKERKKNNIYR